MDAHTLMAGGLRTMMLLVFIIGAWSVLAQGTCDADENQVLLENRNALVPAMFVFGDSVLDAGTNSLFPSLLQANYKPYGQQFGGPTGRFTNGRTYADFLAEKIGLPSPDPYLKRKGKWSILQGVNYASAGSGVLETTNAASVVIPFPNQLLQFEQTRISITETLGSASGAEFLFSKSLFLINIGGNDVVTYFFTRNVPADDFLRNLIDVIEESVGKLYKAGGRKFVLLGTGPIGCVPGFLVPVGVKDGHCLDSANELAKAFNAAVEDLVLNKLPKSFPDVKAIVGKPFEIYHGFVVNGTAGFTEGVKACCGSGLYNAEAQCGRPLDLIKNPPNNVCDNVDAYVFWDYFHPTERAYGLLADKFWGGGLDYVAPMNLQALVKLC